MWLQNIGFFGMRACEFKRHLHNHCDGVLCTFRMGCLDSMGFIPTYMLDVSEKDENRKVQKWRRKLCIHFQRHLR